MGLTARHASTQSLGRCAQLIGRGRIERQEALDRENRSNTRHLALFGIHQLNCAGIEQFIIYLLNDESFFMR